nr:MAG TPA: Paired amphipathic helix protein [Caudoviricetes sp.]
MDAVEFLKTAERRYKSNPHDYANYIQLCGNDFGAYVDELEKWAKEHPVKTRQSEFLKMFPNAIVMTGGALCVRPCDVDNTIKNLCKTTNCGVCRLDYWLQEVE